MTLNVSTLLQVVVALGLYNVWLVRANRATSYRGGASKTLREEFKAYGLSDAVFRLVGALKLGCATLLLAGLGIPALTAPAAAVVAVLMVGAIVMHIKAKDPVMKSVPALSMLLMSAWIVLNP
jgi:hypothetical protein